MTVDSLQLREFSAFGNVTLAFVPGINVFIGTNGTGKSHAMKALYASLKTFEPSDSTIPIEARLIEKFARVFKPEDGDVGRLVRRRGGPNRATVVIAGTPGRMEMLWTHDFADEEGELRLEEHTWQGTAPSIFLPTREVLAMYEGFVAAYNDRELSFDETYYDACVALSASALRGPRSVEAAALAEPIEAALGGKVVLRGNRFYVNFPDGLMEAHLVAEGLRKIAGLGHLITNGSLARNGVLFWDEPEANLNPQLVSMVVDLLVRLAGQGVQIFVSTHDYLLSHKLSLLAEYGQAAGVAVRFFSFHRPAPGDPVQVTDGGTLSELPENPILAEFTKHYDFERRLFDASAGTPRVP